MAKDDELNPSETALLIQLMAEARAVPNTKLGFKLEAESREKLNRLKLIRTFGERPMQHELADKGWVHLQSELNITGNGSKAVVAALASLFEKVRGRVLPRTHWRNLTEMFAETDIAPNGSSSSSADNLEVRVRHAYAALAAEPGAWVGLARLRPFFGDVKKSDLDKTLRAMSRAADVSLAPENNQKALTDADRAAAVNLGGQDKHLLAIGV